jgi:hypothetical protein
MTGKHFAFQEDYDEYVEETKLEARFDPLTIQLLVVEAIPKHAAYGLMFDEYLKQRSRFYEYDASEKKRLSFYLPLFPAMLSADFATEYKISYHAFLVRLVELGLIHFMYDYHEEYQFIKTSKKNLSKLIHNETKKAYYLQLNKQNICLGSCNGARSLSTKHFTPSVPEWLYNAASDCSAYINTTTSDFIYLCWCIGLVETIPSHISNPVILLESELLVKDFSREIKILNERIKDIVCEISTPNLSRMSKMEEYHVV